MHKWKKHAFSAHPSATGIDCVLVSSEERSNQKIGKAKMDHVVGDMLESNCNNFNH